MDVSFYRIILFGFQIERLKNFYLDNLGLVLLEEIRDEWVVMKAGPIEIALHKIGQDYIPENNSSFKADSNTKLIFRIEQDLPAFRQKMIDKGVLLKEIRSFNGINALFCDGEDPEGNAFQLEQRNS